MKYSLEITLCAVLLSLTALAGNDSRPGAVAESAGSPPPAATISAQDYLPGQPLWPSMPHLGVALVFKGEKDAQPRWVYLIDVEKKHVHAVRVEGQPAFKEALLEIAAPTLGHPGHSLVIIGDIIGGGNPPPPPPSGGGEDWDKFAEDLLGIAGRMHREWEQRQAEVQAAVSRVSQRRVPVNVLVKPTFREPAVKPMAREPMVKPALREGAALQKP